MMNSKQIAAIALTLIIVVPIGLGYAMNTEQHDVTVTEVADSFNVSDSLLNATTPYYGALSSSVLNGPIITDIHVEPGIYSPNFVSTGSTVTTMHAYTSTRTPVTFSDAYHITWEDNYAFWTREHVNLTTSAGENIYAGRDVSVHHFASGYTLVDGVTYDNITEVIVTPRTIGTQVSMDIVRTQQTSDYVDQSYGWRIPTGGSVWTCGHECREVRIMVELDPSAYANPGFTIDPRLDGAHIDTITITSDGGLVSVNGQQLGAYRFLELVIGAESTAVYGITEWPAMGLPAVRMNSVLLDGVGQDFDSLGIFLAPGCIFRVDAATVVAGVFPSTKDFTLDLGALFPGSDMALRINSVGVYGDEIVLPWYGERTYTLENGVITFANGVSAKVVGSVWSWEFVRSQGAISMYKVYVNGQDTGEVSNGIRITFAGEWSLTATALKTEQRTESVEEWVPGGFALDKTGVCAAGVAVAGITFIGLGMTGRMQGSKAVLLLLICGGAAAFYLMLI